MTAAQQFVRDLLNETDEDCLVTINHVESLITDVMPWLEEQMTKLQDAGCFCHACVTIRGALQ